MKVEQVAEITGFSADWVRKIARCYNALGAEGIVDGHQKSPGGKQKALTCEQQKQLFERLQSPPDDGGLWSGPKVGELIKQQFGIRIHRTTAWKQLKRLGLTLQVPRPLHEKSATSEQRTFFKAQLKFFVRLMRWLCPHKQVEVWAQDEARLGLKPVVRRTWALGEKGILQSMSTRTAFLQDPNHRIRFVYTPKHASWLNQIELWFSILVRRLLKRGNFSSTDDLKEQILSFIDYFNRTLAKPFQWTYKGRPLVA